jgi:hypothetical protein
MYRKNYKKEKNGLNKLFKILNNNSN